MLYNQLRYFLYLFDIEKERASNPGMWRSPQEYITANEGVEFSDEILTLAVNHGDFLQRMRQTVEKYLEHNGRRWVDMGSLFSFMKL
jgi:DNA polymerase alpha subunit A